MKTILALWLSGFGIWAIASIPNDAVVKTHSYLKGSDLIHFKGSGLLFKHLNRSFVIGSEHTALNENGEFGHSMWNTKLGDVPARLLVADWGSGLVLWEVFPRKPLENLPSLADLKSRPVAAKDPASAKGFPFATKVLKDGIYGAVEEPKDPRILIPLISYGILLLSEVGEFGMSGGPVVNSTGEFLGILSHQYLRYIGGGKAKTLEYDREMSVLQNHLFVIPAEFVQTWLSDYFRSPERFLPAMVKNARLQIKESRAVLTRGLRFEVESEVASSTLTGGKGGGEGVGTGGSEGVGTGGEEGGSEGVGTGGSEGGSEGVGTGGNEGKASPALKPITVRIYIDEEGSRTDWRVPQSPETAASDREVARRLDEWVLKTRKELLLPGAKVRVPYFARRDPETRELTLPPRTFTSLSQFFHALLQPDLFPIKSVEWQSVGDSAEDIAKDLVQTGKGLQSPSQALLKSVTNARVPSHDTMVMAKSKELLQRVLLVGSLLEADPKLVEMNDIKTLLDEGEHGRHWDYLFDLAETQTADLRGKLIHIKRLIYESQPQ